MPDPSDAQIAISAMSCVAGLGMISVGMFLVDRARRLEITARVGLAGVIAGTGGYALAVGITLRAGLLESVLLTLLSLVLVVTLATRYGRRRIGAHDWGMTYHADLEDRPRSATPRQQIHEAREPEHQDAA